MLRLFTTLILFISADLMAKPEAVFCPAVYYKKVKKIVESSGQYDKYKHCGVSCLLTLRCLPTDVLQLGILKELADTLGAGSAEFEDLRANYKGVKLVVERKAKTDQACLSSCHKLYPSDSCHE